MEKKATAACIENEEKFKRAIEKRRHTPRGRREEEGESDVSFFTGRNERSRARAPGL